MYFLMIILVGLMSSAAFAQGAVTPNSAVPSTDVPPGGCMPIGITAAGEMVFPIQCKNFIDKERGATAKPTEGEKAAAQASPEIAPVESKPAARPLPKKRTVGAAKPRDKAEVQKKLAPPISLEPDGAGTGFDR
jgi:hypothetical protein